MFYFNEGIVYIMYVTPIEYRDITLMTTLQHFSQPAKSTVLAEDLKWSCIL